MKHILIKIKERSNNILNNLFFVLIFLLILGFAGCYNRLDTTNQIVIENDNLMVFLNKEKPVVNKYLLKKNNAILQAANQNSAPEILVFHGADSIPASLMNISYKSAGNSRGVTYNVSVAYDNKPAVEFELIYTLTGNELKIQFDNVTEHENFFLIHVQLPDLISVSAAEPAANLIIPADAGRLVDIKTSEKNKYEYEIDWRWPILAGMVYNNDILGVLNSESIENHTISEVLEIEGTKSGSFSMKIMHRLKEYDLVEFGPVVPVLDPEYLLHLQNSCVITVAIVSDFDSDGEVSWVDGAKWLREKVEATPNPFYKDKTFVRTFVDRPPTKRDPTGLREELPFDDVLKRIRDFAAQTDSAACVMYLLGWQYEGHDTGYPSVDKVNENLGGFDRLVNLIKEAKKYNVTVTFYDNYDDAYPNHPGWDPDVICRDAQGNLMKGGVWEENQSYLISPYKYALKSGLERVRFTLNRYPIEDAYFIDVLAGGYHGGRKYDFNPESPAGANKNLEGKKMIVDEFNKNGIDVATEDFTGFFVGIVGTFGDIIAFNDVYFNGEQQIPLIPFIYQNKTSYGMKISNRSFYVKTFLYGQRAQKFTNSRSVYTPADYVLDALPKQKFYGETMKSYEKDGDMERVIWENGSVVEINLEKDEYSVYYKDGALIAKNYTSFVPVKENIYMACSRDGGVLSYKLPAAWDDIHKIHVVKMDDPAKNHIGFKINEGNLEFQTDPNSPYKIYYQ